MGTRATGPRASVDRVRSAEDGPACPRRPPLAALVDDDASKSDSGDLSYEPRDLLGDRGAGTRRGLLPQVPRARASCVAARGAPGTGAARSPAHAASSSLPLQYAARDLGA